MTNQEKIQALTDKIDELLGGEIKKLDFGCMVIMKQYKGDDMDMVNASISKPVPIVTTVDGVSGVKRMQFVDNFGNIDTDGLKLYLKGEDSGFTIGKSRIKEIIGRPILPHDILRALRESYILLHDGTIATTSNSMYYNETQVRLDLSKPLHEQSETTVSELYKLFFE